MTHVFPCFGINTGYTPNTELSCNATDTESFLYGIDSTNLVKPKGPFTADVKCVPGIKFFNRLQTYFAKTFSHSKMPASTRSFLLNIFKHKILHIYVFDL